MIFVDYENFYPKEKKEIPKGNEQRKSGSKGTWGGGIYTLLIYIFILWFDKY